MSEIYGIHDKEGQHILDGKGFCITPEIVGDGHGADYTWMNTIPIVRLNWSYGYGSIPLPSEYEQFSNNVARFVQNSQGCIHWCLANEMNMPIEQPGQPIYPSDYARCYALCYNKIKSVNSRHQVIVGAVAPWNNQTQYEGNERGDWVKYLEDVLHEIYDYGITPDSVAVHCYSHGPSPALITDMSTMDYPFEDRLYNFRCYRDFLQVIPPSIPVYITETDQDDTWLNENNGWVQEAYREINDWNVEHNYQIKCLCLYRWDFDKYALKDKDKVLDDLALAMEHNYTTEATMPVISDGFESGFYAYQGIGELECPIDWEPRWLDDPQQGILDRPEYKPAGQAQIRTGEGASAIHSRYQTIDGVLIRYFNVSIGNTVKAQAWMMKEGMEGGSGMQVGIDPYGGDNLESSNVVWSEWYSQYAQDWQANAWRLREVQTISEANVVTVFLRSKCDTAVEGSHAHFDDFEFEYGGDEPPIPPSGGIMEYIDAIQASLDVAQADLNALRDYVESNSILALPL